MLRFDPPEFQDQLAQAIRSLVQVTNQDINTFSEEVINVNEKGFDPSSYPDQTITPATKVFLSLPEADCARPLARNYHELTDLALELESVELNGDYECRTKNRILVRVDYLNSEAYEILSNAASDPETESDKELQQKLMWLNMNAKELMKKLHDYEHDASNVKEERRNEWQDTLQQYRDVMGEKKLIEEKTRRPFDRFFSSESSILDQTVVCSLTQGVTIYSLLLLAEGIYDDYLPPGSDDDLFIEIRFQKELPREIVDNILQAYLFELSSSLGIDLKLVPIPSLDGLELDAQERESTHRFRPLVLGKGMTEPLKLYNQATIAEDSEIQILMLAKVIEYVSQTVLRQTFVETVRAKLLSPRALEPDAQFIIELAQLIEEQRVFSKDREAIRLTIKTCCDATELAKVTPPFIKELAQISPDSKQADREKALDKAALCLADTRNSIAHAKANYSPTGNECPLDEIAQFVECMKLAAQQAIRWYHSQSEIIRVR